LTGYNLIITFKMEVFIILTGRFEIFDINFSDHK